MGRTAPLATTTLRGQPLPPLCRPSGWIAQWRRIGALSVLDCTGTAFL